MMGKRSAQALAREERLSWGDLLCLVDKGPPDERSSTVNSGLSIGYCRDLYRKIIAERSSEEKPRAWRPDIYSGRVGTVKPSKDFMIVTNILRDFGP